MHDVRIETVACGDRLLCNPGDIEVLSPPVFGTDDSDNSNSVVVLVSYENKKVLLTGDLESTGMELLLSTPPIDVDVLLVPHHGSLHSSPTKLTRWCQPESVVISGSRKRISEGVELIFAQSGARVFRTDRDGAIRFEFNVSGIEVTPFVTFGGGDHPVDSSKKIMAPPKMAAGLTARHSESTFRPK